MACLFAHLYSSTFASHTPCSWQAINTLEWKAAAAVKYQALTATAFNIIALAALRYGQQEVAAAQLLARLRRHEHMALLVAQAAKFAEERHNSTQLVGGVA